VVEGYLIKGFLDISREDLRVLGKGGVIGLSGRFMLVEEGALKYGAVIRLSEGFWGNTLRDLWVFYLCEG